MNRVLGEIKHPDKDKVLHHLYLYPTRLCMYEGYRQALESQDGVIIKQYNMDSFKRILTSDNVCQYYHVLPDCKDGVSRQRFINTVIRGAIYQKITLCDLTIIDDYMENLLISRIRP